MKKIALFAMAAAVAAVMIPVAADAQCATGYCGGYGYGYNRPGTYNYNVTGGWPGSGPYDSAIATTGISAGASVLNNIISSIVAPPRTTVVQSQGPTVIQTPGPTVVQTPAYGAVAVPVPAATPGAVQVIVPTTSCGYAVVGYDAYGRQILRPIC